MGLIKYFKEILGILMELKSDLKKTFLDENLYTKYSEFKKIYPFKQQMTEEEKDDIKNKIKRLQYEIESSSSVIDTLFQGYIRCSDKEKEIKLKRSIFGNLSVFIVFSKERKKIKLKFKTVKILVPELRQQNEKNINDLETFLKSKA